MKLSIVSQLFLLSVAFCEDCGLSEAGIGLDAGSMTGVNQEVYLQSALESCVIHTSNAGEVVRLFRNSQNCPNVWAISCLDHFNCEDILHDVSEPLRAGLASLGLEDIVIGRTSSCLELVPDCGDRQHLILNANLMNAKWAELLPRTVILVNLEQLVAYPQPKALAAAYIAVEDSRGDDTVVTAGEVSLKQALAFAELRLVSLTSALTVSVSSSQGW